MKRLAVLGASGQGKVVADIALLTGWCNVDFFDDRWPGLDHLECWPVVGDTGELLNNHVVYDGVVVAIGNNHARLIKQQLLQDKGASIVSLVHPSAMVSPYAEIGIGSVVMANASINPFVKIGAAVIVNTGCNVDHDCILADGVHISPGVCLGGGVQVGRLSWVGIGAAVIQQVAIGEKVIVGAGSTVISDVPDDSKVVGSPAKSIN